MKYTKGINYIFINPYQGFPVFLSEPDKPPINGSDVKMNIGGKMKDCFFQDGVVTFTSSTDAPQEDTKTLYLTYET